MAPGTLRSAGIGLAAADRAGDLRRAAGRPAAGRPAGCSPRGGGRTARAARRLSSLELDGRGGGLDALRRRAFVAGPFDDPITGEGYAYRHALLRDAGYASLARAERARLHVAMARWLAETAGDRADIVAEAVAEHHASALESLPALAGGDLPDRATLMREAAAWYERAADAALRLAAHRGGAAALRRSIELTDPASPLDLARRRLRLGEILAAAPTSTRASARWRRH